MKILEKLLLMVLLFVSPSSYQLHADDKSTQLDKSPSVCKLTYGWSEGKPLHSKNGQGELEGLQIDLIRAIANEMGCQLAFVEGSWFQLLEKIRLGEIDLISHATPSEERKQYAVFSTPYHQDSFAVYVRYKDKKSSMWDGSVICRALVFV